MDELITGMNIDLEVGAKNNVNNSNSYYSVESVPPKNNKGFVKGIKSTEKVYYIANINDNEAQFPFWYDPNKWETE